MKRKTTGSNWNERLPSERKWIIWGHGKNSSVLLVDERMRMERSNRQFRIVVQLYVLWMLPIWRMVMKTIHLRIAHLSASIRNHLLKCLEFEKRKGSSPSQNSSLLLYISFPWKTSFVQNVFILLQSKSDIAVKNKVLNVEYANDNEIISLRSMPKSTRQEQLRIECWLGVVCSSQPISDQHCLGVVLTKNSFPLETARFSVHIAWMNRIGDDAGMKEQQLLSVSTAWLLHFQLPIIRAWRKNCFSMKMQTFFS